jgi:uncharacterized protein (TIGR03435 family)
VIARSPDIDQARVRKYAPALTGTYDVDFVWAPDAVAGPGASLPRAGGTSGSFLSPRWQEQLGLKLQPRREPMEESFVIESVDPADYS